MACVGRNGQRGDGGLVDRRRARGRRPRGHPGPAREERGLRGPATSRRPRAASTEDEFPEGEESDEGPDPYDGTISLSGSGSGGGPSVNSGKKAKSNPTFNSGFEGLNHYQQRYSRGGNQFSVEPPDQGLCVGNGYVVEAVNDVLNVFDAATGASALPDNTATNIVGGFPRNVNHAVDLNSFYGYGRRDQPDDGYPSRVRHRPDVPVRRGDAAVLPRRADARGRSGDGCVHDREPPRPGGQPDDRTRPVRGTSTGSTSRTTARTPAGANPGPYLGDYPHIGADANGIYLTTNAYPWCCNGFSGAQIYALSKAQLAAGAASVTMQHFDTSGMVNAPSDAGSTQPGFTLWPAQSPGPQFNGDNLGTEYFLSSNAADEAQKPVTGTAGTRTSNQLIVWTLTNTASLNTASPALSLSNKILTVGQYGVPPKQQQPGSGTGRPGHDASAAGLLHQRHDDRRRSPASAAGGCSSARAGHNEVDLEARLERHPHAAGDVRERQAVGRARHGAQPGRRARSGPASPGTSSTRTPGRS